MTDVKIGLVGSLVKFHPTDTPGELSNVFYSPVSVTKNQGERISAFLWMFVEISHEMYFSTTLNE